MKVINCSKDLTVSLTAAQNGRNPVQKHIDGCVKEMTELNCSNGARCREQCPYLIKVESQKRRLP